MWSLNRSTLRSALNRLRERGIIYSESGKGYFVQNSKFLRNLQDLRPVKELALEQGKQVQTEVIRQQVLEADAPLAEKLKLAPGAPVLELLRLRRLDGQPAMLEYSYINLAKAPGLERENFNKNSLYEVLSERYGVQPETGQQSVSITTLNEAEAELFRLEAGTPMLYLRGITYALGEQVPFETFKSIVRDDLVNFSCTLLIEEGDQP